MNKLLTSCFLLPGIAFFFSSCVRDSVSECFSSVRLDFSYSADMDDEENVMSDYIDHASGFVYDSDGNLVSSFLLDKEELSSSVSLSLPDGAYELVVWGNALDFTEFVGTQSYATARLHGVGYPDGIVTNDHLYYGTQSFTVSGGTSTGGTISFWSAHINMEVYIKGFSGTPVLALHSLAPQYDFSMRHTDVPLVSYLPVVSPDSSPDTYQSKFQVLRFGSDTPIELEILGSGGASLYRLALKDLLSGSFTGTRSGSSSFSSAAIEVEGIQELTIPIELEFTKAGVKVQIYKWGIEGVVPL